MKDIQEHELPHNIEAEQQFLGALLGNNDLLDQVEHIINTSSFYDPVHARIFERIASRVRGGRLASPVTLATDLAADEGLKELGGSAYLARLAGAAVASFMIVEYADTLADLHDRRKVVSVMRETAAAAEDATRDLHSVMAGMTDNLRAAGLGAPAALPTLPASELAGKAVPPREWLVEELIPHGTVTILSGDGGTGKSLIALQLAAACAAGTHWLGRRIERSGPALLVSAEDSAEELHRRLAAVAEAEGHDLAALGDLHLASLAGEDAILARTDRATGALRATDRYREVFAAVKRLRPALVVLDTLADLFGGNENARPDAVAFIALLRHIAIDGNCAVLLLAHPSLSGLSSGSGMSGSTGWNNSVRSRLYFERITSDGFEPDTNARVLKTQKANYAPRGEEISLRYDAGRFVVEGGEAGLDRMAAGAKAQRVVLKLLAQFEEQGRAVSPHPGPSFLPSVFAGEPGAEGLGRKALHRAMSELFAAGRIEAVEYGPPSKRRTKIVEADQ